MRSSTGSSPSHTLRLRLGRSRLRGRCLALLAATYLTLLGCLLARGHFSLVLLIGLPLVLLYRELAADRWRGATLDCTAGRWSMLERGVDLPLEFVRGRRALAWVVYLEFRRRADAGRVALFVFRDALPPEAYRRLRVRLALTPEPGVPGKQGGVVRHQHRIPRLR